MQLGKEMLYLTQSDVKKVHLPMPELIDLLEDAFIEKSYGRYEMPPKPGIHTRENSYIHAMPCWVPKQDAAGMKWVAGYPANQAKGLPYISGLLILNDTETGLPIAVMDCGWITAVRTGAVSGLSVKRLANPDSEVLGILGCGVQGRSNIEAILAVAKNIKRVYAFDIFPEVTKKYVAEESAKYGVEIIGVATPKEAVVESDILVTAGPILTEPQGVIEKEWLKEGVTLAPVDFDCMFKPRVIEDSVSKCYTDDIGQYQKFKSMGYFPHGPETLPELADVIAKKIPARENKKEKIAAMNIGMALDDMPTAKVIYTRAIEKGIGTVLPL